MTAFSKNTPNLVTVAIVSVVALLANGGHAQAGTDIKFAFQYDKAAPMSVVYEELATAAKLRCEDQYKHLGARRACEAALMDEVVSEIANKDLTQLHEHGHGDISIPQD